MGLSCGNPTATASLRLGEVVVDAGADLIAHAQVEGQSGCCSPAPAATTGCCSPASVSPSVPQPVACSGCCGTAGRSAAVHEGLADPQTKYDVNDYAAGVNVRVYAVKPRRR